MATRTHRFKPPTKCNVGGYELDAFVVEENDETGELDFRLELGRELFIYWALPAAKDDRLRLVLVDCAVAEVDTGLVEDPFVGALPSTTFAGQVTATIELDGDGGYRCQIVSRGRAPVELRWRPTP